METLQKHALPPSERRKYPRLSGHFPVDAALVTGSNAGDEIHGEADNISKEGLSLTLKTDIPVGDQVSLVIYDGEYDSLCVGSVVWQRDLPNAGHRYGIKILHWSYLDPTLQRELN